MIPIEKHKAMIRARDRNLNHYCRGALSRNSLHFITDPTYPSARSWCAVGACVAEDISSFELQVAAEPFGGASYVNDVIPEILPELWARAITMHAAKNELPDLDDFPGEG